jgi:NADH:ubiquinone oxidoreductase subunit E
MSAEPICCEVYGKIDAVIERKGKDPDSLIEILHGVQEELGYLPQPVLEYIAETLRIPPGAVEGVVTFYSFFTMTPRGRHTVKVCQGTACYVRGGKQLLDAAVKHCGCGVGETSEDLRYSLDVVRCVGACGLSPVMTINDEVFERVKPTKLPEILSKCE